MPTTRLTRTKKYWPVAAGLSAASVGAATTTLFSRGEIRAGDTPIVTAANVTAGALVGSVTGVFAVCTDGVVTITHPAAAGGELFHVVVIPQGMTP